MCLLLGSGAHRTDLTSCLGQSPTLFVRVVRVVRKLSWGKESNTQCDVTSICSASLACEKQKSNATNPTGPMRFILSSLVFLYTPSRRALELVLHLLVHNPSGHTRVRSGRGTTPRHRVIHTHNHALPSRTSRRKAESVEVASRSCGVPICHNPPHSYKSVSTTPGDHERDRS